MDSSFSTTPSVKAELNQRVDALFGQDSGLRRRVVEVIYFGYRYFFKPALFALSGPYQQCRHPVSCGEYAREQFSTQTFFRALQKSAVRVMSCHPWSKQTETPQEETRKT